MEHGGRHACVLVALAAFGCATAVAPGTGAPGPAAAGASHVAPTPPLPPQAVFYPRLGNPNDDTHGSLGPGVALLNGGLSPAAAIQWMHDTVARGRVAGDVVVLCTHGDDEYAAALYAAAPFNSVQTVLVPPGASDGDVELVAERLRAAEVVLLADGDVAAYVGWGGGPIAAALLGVFDRGGVLAGSGAGASALGAAVLTTDVAAPVAVANPYDAAIELAPGPLGAAVLAGTIIDRRTRALDRFGRLAAVTARAVADGLSGAAPAMCVGLGLDDGTAVAIDRAGRASLLVDGAAASAWIVHGGGVDLLSPGQPLSWKHAEVTRLDAPGETYALTAGCGTAFSYAVAIDGAAPSPFSPADPYDAPGTSSPCP